MTTFQDHNGKPSSMRLMCFMSLLSAIAIGHLTVLGYGTEDGPVLCAMFLVAAFAPKAVQNFAEKQLERKS